MRHLGTWHLYLSGHCQISPRIEIFPCMHRTCAVEVEVSFGMEEALEWPQDLLENSKKSREVVGQKKVKNGNTSPTPLFFN